MAGKTQEKQDVTDSGDTVQDEVEQQKDPVVIPALKSAASVTGHGLHAMGASLADFNLRKVGRGVKFLGRKVPRIRIERVSESVEAQQA